MISRTSFPFALGVIFLGTTTFAQAPVDSPVPADTAIRQILADRIGGENLGIGMVTGAIDQKGRRDVSSGRFPKDDKRPRKGPASTGRGGAPSGAKIQGAQTV